LTLTAGNVTLSGTNTYTGATTITAGTLKLGNANALSINTVTVGTGATSRASLDLNGQTIANHLVLSGFGDNGNGALTNSANSGATVSGEVRLGTSANNAQIGSNAGDITLSGVISGAGTLSKIGSDKLIITNADNTYSGATQIINGEVSISGLGSVASSAAIVLGDRSTFRIAQANSTVTINKLLSSSSATLAGSSTVVLGSNSLKLANAGELSDATLQTGYLGVISGTTGGLTLVAGTQTLSGANTFSGPTTIQGGTLVLGHNAALGTGAVNVGSNDLSQATLDLNGHGIDNSVYLYGNGVNGSQGQVGALTNSSMSMASVHGDVVLGGGKTRIGGNYGDMIISGALSGGSNLIKMGSNTLYITHRNDAYTGLAQINFGTLSLVGEGSLASAAGIEMAPSSRFDISGTQKTNIKNLSGSVSSTAANSQYTVVHLGNSRLNISQGNASDFPGVITGEGGVTVSDGNLTLRGISNYSGNTYIGNGNLIIVESGSINYDNVIYTGSGTHTKSKPTPIISKSSPEDGLALFNLNLTEVSSRKINKDSIFLCTYGIELVCKNKYGDH
jgi:autotransporter-associated beta strand protein